MSLFSQAITGFSPELYLPKQVSKIAFVGGSLCLAVTAIALTSIRLMKHCADKEEVQRKAELNDWEEIVGVQLFSKFLASMQTQVSEPNIKFVQTEIQKLQPKQARIIYYDIDQIRKGAMIYCDQEGNRKISNSWSPQNNETQPWLEFLQRHGVRILDEVSQRWL